tara:strand:- start:21 stop:347 length:327 start_codon:yes stop_codon:yes gene_type:complete
MSHEPENNWPDDVRPLTIGEASLLGVDSDRNIYWDGKQIQTRKTFDLSFWQGVGAVITVLSALAGATVSVLEYFEVQPNLFTETRAETEGPWLKYQKLQRDEAVEGQK